MPVIWACMLSRFSHVQLFATQWAVAHQIPLTMGFSKQEYQSGLPCPSSGDFPYPGISLWPVLYYYFFNDINFILFLNFTILYWFCHISKWICHRYTCVPHPEPSSLFPPHTIPLGHPSAPAPSIQYRASNLDWQLVSYMILYRFQCHSPKSTHPLPLPQSV